MNPIPTFYDTLYHRLRAVNKILETGLPMQKTKADRDLTRLLRQYQLKPGDLRSDLTSERFFKYRNKRERQLLYQVVMMVTNAAVVAQIYGNSAGIFLTELQFCQIRELYKMYRRAFNERLKRMTAAALHDFIRENAIFPNHSQPMATEDQ